MNVSFIAGIKHFYVKLWSDQIGGQGLGPEYWWPTSCYCWQLLNILFLKKKIQLSNIPNSYKYIRTLTFLFQVKTMLCLKKKVHFLSIDLKERSKILWSASGVDGLQEWLSNIHLFNKVSDLWTKPSLWQGSFKKPGHQWCRFSAQFVTNLISDTGWSCQGEIGRRKLKQQSIWSVAISTHRRMSVPISYWY